MAKLSGFADEISPSVDIQIRAMKDLDIHAFEVRGVDGKNISQLTLEETKALHQKLSRNGIVVSALGSPLGKISLSDDFAPHLALFDHMMKQAEILETSYVRIFSFYGADDSTEDQVYSRLDQFMDHTPSGITLLHEDERGIFGYSGERCLRLMKRYAPSGMRTTYDPANFILEHEDTLHCFELLKPYIVYLHVKDAIYSQNRVVAAGEGEAHWPEILSELKQMNFQGYFSIEPHLAEFGGFHALEGLEKQGKHLQGMAEKGEGEDRFIYAVATFRRLLDKAGL